MRTLPTRVFSYRASLPAGQTSSYMSMERRLSSVWIEHISEVQSREVLVKLPGTGSFPLMVSFHWLLMVNRNATFWYNFPLSGFFPKFNYFKKFSILWLQKTVIISLLMMIIWAFFPVIIPFTSALFSTHVVRTILNIMLLVGSFCLGWSICFIWTHCPL